MAHRRRLAAGVVRVSNYHDWSTGQISNRSQPVSTIDADVLPDQKVDIMWLGEDLDRHHYAKRRMIDSINAIGPDHQPDPVIEALDQTLLLVADNSSGRVSKSRIVNFLARPDEAPPSAMTMTYGYQSTYRPGHANEPRRIQSAWWIAQGTIAQMEGRFRRRLEGS